MSAPDIFVSYASEDRDVVERLVQHLRSAGFEVWWDRHITTGRAFDRDIEEALDAARCVLVVWSVASVDSDWVRTEAAEGLDRGVLVPVVLGDIRPPLAFRRLQTVRLDDFSEETLRPVVVVIRDRIQEARAAADTAPASVPRQSDDPHYEPAQAINSRPLLAILSDATHSSDPQAEALSDFLSSVLGEYFQNWPYGSGVVADGAEASADYIVRLKIMADDTQCRISFALERSGTDRRQQVHATARTPISLAEQEDLAGALFRWVTGRIAADLAERLLAVPDAERDYWCLVNLAQGSAPDAAVSYLNRAIELAPDRAIARAKLAQLGTVGRVTRSLPKGALSRQMIHDHAIKAVRMEPNDPFVLIHCTYALSLIGESTLALPLIEEAIRTFPPARVWASFPLVRLGRGDEAVEAARDLREWGLPIAPQHWAGAAEAEAVRQNYEGVIDVSRRGLMRSGNQEMPIRGHYANALAVLGRPDEAREQWRLACELAPGMTLDLWLRGWRSQLEEKYLADRFSSGLMNLADL